MRRDHDAKSGNAAFTSRAPAVSSDRTQVRIEHTVGGFQLQLLDCQLGWVSGIRFKRQCSFKTTAAEITGHRDIRPRRVDNFCLSRTRSSAAAPTAISFPSSRARTRSPSRRPATAMLPLSLPASSCPGCRWLVLGRRSRYRVSRQAAGSPGRNSRSHDVSPPQSSSVGRGGTRLPHRAEPTRR